MTVAATNMAKRKRLGAVCYHVFVCAMGFVMIFPLLWMVASAFKPNSEIFTNAQSLIPKDFTLSNFSTGWRGFAGVSFSYFFRNSLFISVVSTIGNVLSSSCVAFGFSRLRFKGRGLWFAAMMLTLILPAQVVMIPQYLIFEKLGFVGTYIPMILPAYFSGAFFVFLIIQFVAGIPRELDEAAKIDGCSVYGIYVRIILPLIVPALVTCAIFSFMWSWDEFMGPLLYLSDTKMYPVSLALKLFSDPTSQSDWGAMFAMSTLSIIPIFLIFVFFQKHLVEGISTEGLKG